MEIWEDIVYLETRSFLVDTPCNHDRSARFESMFEQGIDRHTSITIEYLNQLPLP